MNIAIRLFRAEIDVSLFLTTKSEFNDCFSEFFCFSFTSLTQDIQFLCRRETNVRISAAPPTDYPKMLLLVSTKLAPT